MTANLILFLALASTLGAQVQIQEVQEVRTAKARAPQAKPSTRPATRPSTRPAGKNTKSDIIEQPVWKEVPGMGRFQFSGAPFSHKKIKSLSAGELLKTFKDLAGKPIRVFGKVEKTCAKKGCWMWVTDIKDPKKKVWVRFKDYGFFVPKKGAEGRLVVMEGVAKEVTFSVKTARHIKEDEGDLEGAKKITKPVKMVQLTATSVMILARKKAPKGTKPGSKPSKVGKERHEDEVEEVEEPIEENEVPVKKIEKAGKDHPGHKDG